MTLFPRSAVVQSGVRLSWQARPSKAAEGHVDLPVTIVEALWGQSGFSDSTIRSFERQRLLVTHQIPSFLCLS